MVPLSDTCREYVNLLFPNEEERTKAERILVEECGDNLPLYRENFDRIRFAVLKLSQGELGRLRQMVGLSKYDWRDALMAAGFGRDERAHLKWAPTK